MGAKSHLSHKFTTSFSLLLYKKDFDSTTVHADIENAIKALHHIMHIINYPIFVLNKLLTCKRSMWEVVKVLLALINIKPKDYTRNNFFFLWRQKLCNLLTKVQIYSSKQLNYLKH